MNTEEFKRLREAYDDFLDCRIDELSESPRASSQRDWDDRGAILLTSILEKAGITVVFKGVC